MGRISPLSRDARCCVVNLFPVKPSPLKESPTGHWRVLWPVLLALTIFAASSQPIPRELGSVIAQWDKAVHFVVYGAMALLIARLRFVQERVPLGAMSAIVFVAVLGLADECLQAWTPGRFCHFDDWLADVLGAVTFVTAYVHWTAYRRWLEHRVVVRDDGGRLRIDLPPVPVPGSG